MRPPLTYHLADIEPDGRVREFRSSDRSDMWINAGYFLLRPEVFDYMNDGEEFVLEPFSRLIEANQLMAYKHEGFWRCMDNLRDRQVLEEMVERGEMPWRVVMLPDAAAERCRSPAYENLASRTAGRNALGPVPRRARRRYRDRRWRHDSRVDRIGREARGPLVRAERHRAARCGGRGFGCGIPRRRRRAAGSSLGQFDDSFFPYQGAEIKAWLKALKAEVEPDVVLTHTRDDAHQDHREVCQLTWNLFRDHLILEYEIPKWDGDLGRPNVYMPLSAEMLERKIDLLLAHFGTQRSKDWFDAETFRGLARLRGMECRSREGYAEAFVLRKAALG